MNRYEAVATVAKARGLEDKYTILITRYAEDRSIIDKEIIRMMYDILLGVDDDNRE